jgi:hypothetical protein
VTASRSSRARRARRLALGVLAVTALLPAAVAEAKPPEQVDPALVVPTLNPDFAPWNCWQAGSGITCQGSYAESYTGVPVGLDCDGQEIHLSGTARERMTRWHTADGRATKTVVHLDHPGDVFSLSPTGDGPGLTISGHFNRHYVYAVPGDPTSRTLTEVGAIYLAHPPGGGRLVLQDTGRVTFAPGADFEVVASSGGVHDAYSDPTALDTAICDALT